VVTDLSMPQMSGFDLAREVLAVRPGIPVLMTPATYGLRTRGTRAQRAYVKSFSSRPPWTSWAACSIGCFEPVHWTRNRLLDRQAPAPRS